jgi:hypothetical protein
MSALLIRVDSPEMFSTGLGAPGIVKETIEAAMTAGEEPTIRRGLSDREDRTT